MSTVSFELGISLGEIEKVQHVLAPVPRLDGHTWFVQCTGEIVTVHAVRDRRVKEIGRAAWLQGRLIERTGSPSDHEWKRVGTALERVMRRVAPARKPIDPIARRIIIGALVMCGLAAGVAALVYRFRTKEPHRASLARYDHLAWRDVSHGGETTIPLILKDPERERGRKLCVTAKVETIERARVDARDVYTGALGGISFVALGSTRTIVMGQPSTLCGVAHGKQIVGLFDLPENK